MKFELPKIFKKSEKLEKKSSLPAENELPLNIAQSEHLTETKGSEVWKTQVKDQEGRDKMIALKQVREERFATDEEMRASKEFYEFLKNFPGFGKFVLDTFYFKARMTSADKPQAFRVQRFIEGKPVDKMKDEELYGDPTVINQLLEFIGVAIELLKTAKEAKDMKKPDFMRTPDFSANARAVLGGLLADPRYSSNVLIADKASESGQRVFFIDTAQNTDERTNKAFELFSRYVVTPIQEVQLKMWKNKLEGILEKNPASVPAFNPEESE